MNYFLGIDQGRTKTNAVICNNIGQILAFGQAPGAYYLLDGIDAQMRAIKSAVASALDKTPHINTIKGLFGGLIGADWPDEQDMLTECVTKLGISQSTAVVNDSFIAMRGGTKNPSGAILIAGTGGNCAIVAPSGEKFLYHFYQEAELQGGTALGRSALTAIYRSETNRVPSTHLKDYVLQKMAVPNVDTLLRQDVESQLPIDVSQLAPLVFKAADSGDAAAIQIIQTFAIGLAGLVTAGLKRYEMLDLPVEVVVSGSIFKAKNPILINTLTHHIQIKAPHCILIQARYEPVVGAAIMALEYWGKRISPEIQKNIENSSRSLGLIRPGSTQIELKHFD